MMNPPTAPPTPGTWRVSDNSAVAFDLATEAWSLAAREILIRTAKRYHAYITHEELADDVQQSTGIRTRSLKKDWMVAVLDKVADDCHLRGEPALTALCVRKDETMGTAYRHVLEIAGTKSLRTSISTLLTPGSLATKPSAQIYRPSGRSQPSQQHSQSLSRAHARLCCTTQRIYVKTCNLRFGDCSSLTRS